MDAKKLLSWKKKKKEEATPKTLLDVTTEYKLLCYKLGTAYYQKKMFDLECQGLVEKIRQTNNDAFKLKQIEDAKRVDPAENAEKEAVNG